jgi:hypothetical protein
VAVAVECADGGATLSCGGFAREDATLFGAVGAIGATSAAELVATARGAGEVTGAGSIAAGGAFSGLGVERARTSRRAGTPRMTANPPAHAKSRRFPRERLGPGAGRLVQPAARSKCSARSRTCRRNMGSGAGAARNDIGGSWRGAELVAGGTEMAGAAGAAGEGAAAGDGTGPRALSFCVVFGSVVVGDC